MLNFFSYTSITPLLAKLIEITAIPLAQVEQDFAVDSSGFSTSQFERWLDVRTGKVSKKRCWKKAHIMVGVKTNIVSSVIITDGTASDSKHFIPVVEKCRKYFDMKEISADKAYSSRANLEAISEMGAVPSIQEKRHRKSRRMQSMATDVPLLHQSSRRVQETLPQTIKRRNIVQHDQEEVQPQARHKERCFPSQ